MSKIISGFHTIWLIVVCIGHLASHLPLSLVLSPLPKVLVLSLTDLLLQLEIDVLIQVCYTFVIFFCWYHKPLDIIQPIHIELQSPGQGDIPNPQADSNHSNNVTDIPTGDRLLGLDCEFIVKHYPPNSIAIAAKACYDLAVHIDGKGPTTAGAPTDDDSHFAHVWPMLLEVSIIRFAGLLHCVAWNSHFPTMLENWRWRGSSVGMFLFLLFTVLIVSWKCTMDQKDLRRESWQVQLNRYFIPGFLISIVTAQSQTITRPLLPWIEHQTPEPLPRLP